MQELLTFMAQSLVDHPDQVSVHETEGPEAVILALNVAEEDVDKVIGKQGRFSMSVYFCESLARSSTRRTLPEMVLGSSSTNSITRGYL